MKFNFLLFIFFIFSIATHGQLKDIQVCGSKFDLYSQLVEKLDKGFTDIDYTNFRKQFILSKCFTNKQNVIKQYDSLRINLDTLSKYSKYFEMIKVSKSLLAIDYTCIPAHQYLRQVFNSIGDSSRSNKHKNIQYGLLKSILGTGDGLSFSTAWLVFQNEEEYSILAMIGVISVEHELIEKDGKIFDVIHSISKKGVEKKYYFNIIKRNK